jgi:hypothetical protein
MSFGGLAPINTINPTKKFRTFIQGAIGLSKMNFPVTYETSCRAFVKMP